MLLKQGEKIHVMIRRNFPDDLRRHFIGEVISCMESAAKVRGYVFVLETRSNQYIRQPELRTRIVSLVDAGNIINIIPAETDIEKVSYKMSEKRHLVVTDDETFTMDVNEFGSRF